MSDNLQDKVGIKSGSPVRITFKGKKEIKGTFKLSVRYRMFEVGEEIECVAEEYLRRRDAVRLDIDGTRFDVPFDLLVLQRI